ncbi:unnamed protein product, partial [Polarella glacialis]
ASQVASVSAAAAFAARAAERTRSLPKSGGRVGTHSGTFQADEALACWLLRQLPDYAQAEVIRSRDLQVLEPLDIVVDVGASYDPSRLRFDHHQRGFFETVDGEMGKAACPEQATGRWKTKLSSAGLVYKHFGREIIARLAGTDAASTELVFAEVYDRLVEAVDCIDNGVEMCEGALRFKDLSGIASRVARLNPRWNEASDEADQYRRFEQASALCGAEFLDILGDVVEGWLPARGVVEAALQKRLQVHPSGQVLRLDAGSLPWRGHLYELERAESIVGQVKFVLYADQVPVEGRPFTNRLSLPESWCGLRAILSCNKRDCCFAHANGFIAGNSSAEGALALSITSYD